MWHPLDADAPPAPPEPVTVLPPADKNADITTEDIFQLLSGELTHADIEERRARIKLRETLEAATTPDLLKVLVWRRQPGERSFYARRARQKPSRWCPDPQRGRFDAETLMLACSALDDHLVNTVLREVLATRPHIPRGRANKAKLGRRGSRKLGRGEAKRHVVGRYAP